MSFACKACVLLLACSSSWALSAVRFTGRDGSVKLISYDGTKLDVPGYCESSTCTTNARGIGANEAAIGALDDAAKALSTALTAKDGAERYARQQADTDIRTALLAEETARVADDAVMRTAVLTESTARRAADKAQEATVVRLASEEKAARSAKDEELEAKNARLLKTLNDLIAKVAALESSSSADINALKTADSETAKKLAALKLASESTDQTLATDIESLNTATAIDEGKLAELQTASEAADATLTSAIKVVESRHHDDIQTLKAKDANLIISDTVNANAIGALDVASKKADDSLAASLEAVRKQQEDDVAMLKAEDELLAAASANRDGALGTQVLSNTGEIDTLRRETTAADGKLADAISVVTKLQGPQGEKGDKGEQGEQGTQGAQGSQGSQGDKGEQGEQGIQGAQGAQGEQGSQGIHGIQGSQGIQGIQGIQGATGAQGVQGDKGEQGSAGALGNKGEKGAKGATGAQGTQGATGAQGEQGEQGDQGTQGSTGSQGVEGDKGDTGATGAHGAKGDKGEQGTQGATGAQGEKGDQGADAPTPPPPTPSPPTPAPSPHPWGRTPDTAGDSCKDLFLKGVRDDGMYYIKSAPLYDHAAVEGHMDDYSGGYAGIDDVNAYAGMVFSSHHPLVGQDISGADMFLKRDRGASGTVQLVLLDGSHTVKAHLGSVQASTLGETAPGGGGVGPLGMKAWTKVQFRMIKGHKVRIAANDILALHNAGGLSYYDNERVYYPEVKNAKMGFDRNAEMAVKHWSNWYPEPMADLKITLWSPTFDAVRHEFCGFKNSGATNPFDCITGAALPNADCNGACDKWVWRHPVIGGLHACVAEALKLRAEHKVVGSFNWDARNGDCMLLGDKGVDRPTGHAFPERSGGARSMVFCADQTLVSLAQYKTEYDPKDRADYFKVGSAWNKHQDRAAQTR